MTTIQEFHEFVVEAQQAILKYHTALPADHPLRHEVVAVSLQLMSLAGTTLQANHIFKMKLPTS